MNKGPSLYLLRRHTRNSFLHIHYPFKSLYFVLIAFQFRNPEFSAGKGLNGLTLSFHHIVPTSFKKRELRVETSSLHVQTPLIYSQNIVAIPHLDRISNHYPVSLRFPTPILFCNLRSDTERSIITYLKKKVTMIAAVQYTRLVEPYTEVDGDHHTKTLAPKIACTLLSLA